ncbi:MAG: helix-hairpin-helix domain-containing protein [bacterium]|nr:helix-hairpin-helix domain-containing protein [bacterium]
MSRTGSIEENSHAWLVERNLRQRAILLSLFAALLLFVDFYPFFQSISSKPSAILSLDLAGGNTPRLRLVEPPAAAVGTAHTVLLPDDCSVPPQFAPFFALAMDINRAQVKDLTFLPGIGPALGRRIVAEREKNGPYENTQALLRVSGIGPQTLAGLAPRICTR